MANPKPIVLIHGYSSEGKATPAASIYGRLPEDLAEVFGPNKVVAINLSRWISLSDGVALDDVSFAMERALASPDYAHLLDTGFHVVIHSTGALVVRNWLRLFPRRPSPIANLVHLAGANFGSGLAHVGQGELARWGRLIFQGVGRGIRVLDELEFGAAKTLDLHLHFRQPGHDIYDDYQVQEFCLIGSQTLSKLRLVPIRYVREDSADNTVRTSACNLNFNYVRVTPKSATAALSAKDVVKQLSRRLSNKSISSEAYYDFDFSDTADSRRQIPFAILFETAHFGRKMGILVGEKNRDEVLPRVTEALRADRNADDYAAVAGDWDAHTESTLRRAAELSGKKRLEWDPQSQYDPHAQLIFRIRDQFGNEVEHHDVTFRSQGKKDSKRLERMIEDKHRNQHKPGTSTFYLRVGEVLGGDRPWRNDLDKVAPLDFEITGLEPKSTEIIYLPLRIALSPEQIRQIIQPFRTTLIDVTLFRLPSTKVFELSEA